MLPFRSILLLVHPAADVEPVLKQVSELARRGETSITVADCVHKPSLLESILPTSNTEDFSETERQQHLQNVVGQLEAADVSARPPLLPGDLAQDIVREVVRAGHDLLIKAADHEHTEGRVAHYGASEVTLMRTCPCAVWITDASTRPRLERVLVAIDAAPGTERHEQLGRSELELAASIADGFGAELHAVYAWHPFGPGLNSSRFPEDEKARQIEKLRQQAADNLQGVLKPYTDRLSPDAAHLVRGEPETAVPQLANEIGADLVVIGTTGRRGLAALTFGNPAEALLLRGHSSLLAVKPADFASPVQ